jgi:ATP-dependent protease ClpP protease subunit
MNKTSNKDEEIIPNLFSREFDFIRTVTQEVKRHDVFLDTDIGEPQNYRDLITLLFNANENDSINIFINSQGGHLNSALAIIEGIKHSNAQVTGIIMGECYSAASMIALNCHNVVVLDSANMMIHTASFGTAGNTSNVKAYTDFTVKEVEKLLVSTYEGFLTSEEIDKIKTGVEIWLSAEDISKRMEIRVKLLEAKEQEVAPTPEPKKPTRRKKQ